jgi:hypothetical protein
MRMAGEGGLVAMGWNVIAEMGITQIWWLAPFPWIVVEGIHSPNYRHWSPVLGQPVRLPVNRTPVNELKIVIRLLVPQNGPRLGRDRKARAEPWIGHVAGEFVNLPTFTH